MSSYRKKLIEVALPLDDINAACVREKSIRHGHPCTLHLWWARRPLAAARAVIFAQMVDDPNTIPGLSEREVLRERERLFDIIRELVKWENTTNEAVLEQARAEIRKSWARTCQDTGDDPKQLPAFHDPFAGGGALPLEAQRLGLVAYASDLNPVAVLINKAMIEIPPKFAGKPPVNPNISNQKSLFRKKWKGAKGLAEDVRYYGHWMREEAEKRIGHLYPKIKVTGEIVKDREDLVPYVGKELTVIAWIWARTVKSPNPVFSHVEVPLASTFMLFTKKGKEVYVEPVVKGDSYHFKVKVGKPADLKATKEGTAAGKRKAFRCLMSGVPITYDYIRTEGKAGRMGARLMAIVCEGARRREYLSPSPSMEKASLKVKPEFVPETPLHGKCRVNVSNYGLNTFGDLFTPRQLIALTTFSDLIAEVREQIRHHACAAGFSDLERPLAEGGTGAQAYADSIIVYLAYGIDKMADRHSTLGRWDQTPTASGIINTFSRQALPMSWDYAEGNPFSRASGNYEGGIGWIAKVIEKSLPAIYGGKAEQEDASNQMISNGKFISTDPPYYDNICYADLSDFFYIWLRRSLKSVFPQLFATMAVPKIEELIAAPFLHEGKKQAEAFFLNGMTRAMNRIAEQANGNFPVTIYYAFKQSEQKGGAGVVSTGWETFLGAVLLAGFGISGTWPMRTELGNRMIGSGKNALASSIILVCRKRNQDAPTATRRDFIRALRAHLTVSLCQLQRANIAPVDLAQSAIGPGMSVFSKYSKVIEADGSPMSIGSALQLINQILDEALGEEEGVLDSDTQFAIIWFETHQYNEGLFGEADNLARARNVSVAGVQEAGILHSAAGKVRLYNRAELPSNWDPTADKRLTVWEATQYLIKRLEEEGEEPAATLLKVLGPTADQARNLAYRLYTICERHKWAEEARAYNGLVIAWPELEKLAGSKPATSGPLTQTDMFE